MRDGEMKADGGLSSGVSDLVIGDEDTGLGDMEKWVLLGRGDVILGGTIF